MKAHLCRDGAAELADEGQLVLLRVPLHDWTPCPHLGHDAAGAPQVDWRPVVSLTCKNKEYTEIKKLHQEYIWNLLVLLFPDYTCDYVWVQVFCFFLTQQQLWRSVPQRHHAVSVAVSLAVLGQAEGSSQTKVGQLQDAVSGYEHIGCLHVSVKDLSKEQQIPINILTVEFPLV